MRMYPNPLGSLFLLLAVGILAANCSAAQVETKAPVTPSASVKRPSWETEWNNTIALAKKEGKISLYTNVSQETRSAMAQSFRDKYAIDIEFTLGAAPELAQKIQTERRANLNLFDVLMSGPTAVMQLKGEGALASIEKLLVLPEVVDTKAWPEGRLPFLDKDKYVLVLTGGFLSYVIANTSLVKNNEITSLQDLLKSRYKGKIVMDDPTLPRSASNWVAYLIKYAMGPEKAKTYLRQLAAQEPALSRDYRQITEWVAQGKMLLGIGASTTIVTEFQRAGAPVAFIRVVEGGVVHPGESNVGLSNKAAHPNASALFVNWLLTPEGQAIYSKASGRPGLRRGTPTEGLDPFTIPRSDDKAYYVDEEFIASTVSEGITIARDIFSPLLK